MYAMFKVQSAYSGWRRHNGSTRCWDCPAWVVTWSLLSLVGSFLFLFCLLSDLCCLLKCDEPGFWICFFLLFSACLPLVRTLYGWSRVYLIFPHLFIFFVLGQCDHSNHWVLLGLEQFGQFVCFWKTQHCFPLALWLDIITSSGDDFSTFTQKNSPKPHILSTPVLMMII